MKALLEFTHDIKDGTLLVNSGQTFVCGDEGAHEIRMTVKENGTTASLAGMTCKAYCVLSNRATTPADAAISGNVVSVTFPAAFYALAGSAYVLLRLLGTNAKIDLLCLKYNLIAGTTSTVYDPSGELPDLSDFQAAIDAANTAAGSANTAASNANAKAGLANAAAGAANSAASAANTAAGTANSAASVANEAASNANAKAGLANTAADNANTKAGLANTAANNADAKANLAGTAAGNANAAASTASENAEAAQTAALSAHAQAAAAAQKAALANAAAGNAQAVADKFATLDVEMEMLSPSADPTGSVSQTADKTTFNLGIPASNLAYATFGIDENNHLIMTSPEGFSGINYIINRENGHLEVQINA